MTTKLTAKRFRIRRPEFPPLPAVMASVASLSAAPRQKDDSALFDNQTDDGFGDVVFPTVNSGRIQSAGAVAAETDLETIRKEGLTGRQLRLARRIAQKHNLPATSDFDAVRLLRKTGIDPFQRSSMLEAVTGDSDDDNAASRALTTTGDDGVRLPQTIKPVQLPSTDVRAEQSHAAEIQNIQRDISRRRRRRSAMLAVRLAFFVLLPTFLCAWYYYLVATPLYSTKAEFVIQQSASPAAAGGLGGLFQGSPLATSQDSIAVQGYLQSRDAMLRLDADHNFRAHFSGETIDPIQRLSPDASLEEAYRTYKRNVLISYDPTEGIIKLEVIAPTPELAMEFSRALIGYAEGQVDQLTQRLREDQMNGAREAFTAAEANMMTAQRKTVELQEQYKVLSSEVEVTLITTQIGQLETQLSQDRLSLEQMLSNAQPNLARMWPLEQRIATIESEIALLRAKLTEDSAGGLSLAKVQSELLVAQADVTTRQMLLAQSLTAMETARMEANRQVRYLSLSVSPTAPDEAAYPRAFENTSVALLIFAGIYLMISMTAAILREQVSA